VKLSARGRYGIQFLIDLAEHSDQDHITLASVAERKGISLRYLEQVVVILHRTGFIRSIKGSAGGYALAHPADQINIGDALRMLEGDMLVVDPPQDNTEETAYQKCIRRSIFEPLNARIAKVIDGKTLASLVGTSDPDESYMYFI
jgi:Rrf2 family protein